jgi:hypothetical protein
MSQQVDWGQRPSKKNEMQASPDKLDAFVNPKAKTKRLNAEIPSDLHARVKAGCALEGREMTDVLIELLEHRFPSR